MWAELAKQFVIGALIVYVLLGAYLFFAQKTLMYYSDHTRHEECVFFDGRVTHNDTRMHIQPGDNRVLIVYHGNAGRACDRHYLAAFTNRTLVVVEYEGYAGQGSPSSKAHHQNARDAHEWAEQQEFSDVAILGESLGSGLAAYHASLGGVSKVALIAPYRSLADVAQHHYRIYPARLLLRERYEVLTYLRSFSGAVLTLHGAHDQIIPPHLSESLPTERILVNAGHNDLYADKEARQALEAFLK